MEQYNNVTMTRCSECEFSSPDPGSLFEHFKADHMTATDTTTEHFREVCSKYWTQMNTWSGKQRLSCAVCDYTAAQSAVMNRHVASRHLKLKLGGRTCLVCQKGLAAGSVNLHAAGHVAGAAAGRRRRQSSAVQAVGGRGRTCPQCNLVLKNENTLRSHTRFVHNGERPFKCPFCDYAASTKACLERHVRSRKHQEGGNTRSNSSNTSQPRAASNSSANTGVRHQCTQCESNFGERRFLQTHMIMKHNSVLRDI